MCFSATVWRELLSVFVGWLCALALVVGNVVRQRCVKGVRPVHTLECVIAGLLLGPGLMCIRVWCVCTGRGELPTTVNPLWCGYCTRLSHPLGCASCVGGRRMVGLCGRG